MSLYCMLLTQLFLKFMIYASYQIAHICECIQIRSYLSKIVKKACVLHKNEHLCPLHCTKSACSHPIDIHDYLLSRKGDSCCDVSGSTKFQQGE